MKYVIVIGRIIGKAVRNRIGCGRILYRSLVEMWERSGLKVVCPKSATTELRYKLTGFKRSIQQKIGMKRKITTGLMPTKTGGLGYRLTRVKSLLVLKLGRVSEIVTY
jgi:hypothetical protein